MSDYNVQYFGMCMCAMVQKAQRVRPNLRIDCAQVFARDTTVKGSPNDVLQDAEFGE